MFIYYYATIPSPREAVEDTVLEALDGLPDHADIAYRHGEEIRARLGPGSRTPAKAVHLDVGAPMRSSAETTVPMVWTATGTPGLFPRLEGDLVIASMGSGLTHLALRGSYRPPLGPVGRVLDRALLHRVAEASVKRFVDRLAAAVTDRVMEPAARGG
jgi:hypothetical protein